MKKIVYSVLAVWLMLATIAPSTVAEGSAKYIHEQVAHEESLVAATTADIAVVEPSQFITTNQKFTDIPNDFWAKNEVMQLVEQGIIGGYPDGEFRPTITITRGQVANLVAGALQLPPAPFEAKFKDVSKQSSYAQGVLSTYKAGIFGGQADGRFGVSEPLTREQMATTLVRAFKLQNTGEAVTFKDEKKIGKAHRENVKILAQHGITRGREDGTFGAKDMVSRATFTVMLHRALVVTGQLNANRYKLTPAVMSAKFKPTRQQMNFAKVTGGQTPLYIRSVEAITAIGSKTEKFELATDAIFHYAIGTRGATVEVTVRTLNNGDRFVFTTLNNPAAAAVTVDLFEVQKNITNTRLYRVDQNKFKKPRGSVSSYPTGLLRTMSNGELVTDRMIGQAYRSKQLVQSYARTNGKSYMRDLKGEYEAVSTAALGTDFLSVYTLKSNGKDNVDTWFMDSTERLFKTDAAMNAWMLETIQNFKKRNAWYTADGPYNKMATTTEPMPKSGQGYGRNLLLVKEDRALALYEEQGDRYFGNVVRNSFVNLTKFKGKDKYWETEVTSTYLKNLYGMTAPFIDTRYNEQIALFYYHAGETFGLANYKQPLRNYANLLVSRKAVGQTVNVSASAYYISDYFPVNQQATAHSSMNHLLGGLNILLLAYQEFGDKKYLQTANAIQKALTIDKKKWLRANGDIWYRINAQGKFAGTDYRHLTLEDLINTYKMWEQVDKTKLPVIKEMIVSKAGYLSRNNLGYTIKIQQGLRDIGMLKYLPRGPRYTDAL